MNAALEPSPSPAVIPDSDDHGPSPLYGKPTIEPNYLNEATREAYQRYGGFKFESNKHEFSGAVTLSPYELDN